MLSVEVQTKVFDVGAEIRALAETSRGVGAVVSFVGLVRDINLGDSVASLELEHYPGMTERAIITVVDRASQRWQLLAVKVIHRIGHLEAGEPVVFVGAASAHRRDAFAACEFIMDYLKTEAPLWKKEHTPDGARWVDARAEDQLAVSRWNE